MTKQSVGYIGLGLMGGPMTMRLINSNHDVFVWNRSKEKLEPAQQAGATIASTPNEVATNTEIVFMCLTDASAVEAVVFGSDGLAHSNGAKYLVDFSSIHPVATQEMAKRLKAANGMIWIDAPVSGGVPGAKDGSLAIMAGGDQKDIDFVRPVVMQMCQRFTRMGPVGAGQTTKLANQILSGGIMTLAAEAVNFAQRAGVDASMLPEALAGGFADSKPFQIFAPKMAARDFANPLGAISTMLKDLDTVREVGKSAQAILPLTSAAAEIMRATVNRGHGEDDISTMILTYSGEE